eukprot:1051583-Prorocentrum_minimum.AAC.4
MQSSELRHDWQFRTIRHSHCLVRASTKHNNKLSLSRTLRVFRAVQAVHPRHMFRVLLVPSSHLDPYPSFYPTRYCCNISKPRCAIVLGCPSPEPWHDLAELGKPQGITTDIATRLGRDLFGLNVQSCKELPSERDRNFLLAAAPPSKGSPPSKGIPPSKGSPSSKGSPPPAKYVLKLCNLTEDPDVADMQVHASPSPALNNK